MINDEGSGGVGTIDIAQLTNATINATVSVVAAVQRYKTAVGAIRPVRLATTQ